MGSKRSPRSAEPLSETFSEASFLINFTSKPSVSAVLFFSPWVVSFSLLECILFSNVFFFFFTYTMEMSG